MSIGVSPDFDDAVGNCSPYRYIKGPFRANSQDEALEIYIALLNLDEEYLAEFLKLYLNKLQKI